VESGVSLLLILIYISLDKRGNVNPGAGRREFSNLEGFALGVAERKLKRTLISLGPEMRFKSGAKTQIVDQAISPRAEISIEYKSKANINLTTLATLSLSFSLSLLEESRTLSLILKEKIATRVRFK
jgi:hypothetical protein